MAASGGAAGWAVDRLRAARERARTRREASQQAVERLRQRNGQESRTLAERAGSTRRQPRLQLPEHGRPRQPGQPPPDDDWSQQSWLH